MKLTLKAYMSKEAFFELPSAEQRKKAEKYDVYKKYLKEGKNSSKKPADKPASKPAKKALDKKTAQAIKDEKDNLIELTESLRDLKFEQATAKRDGDEESVDSLQQEIDELVDSINSSKARIKDLRSNKAKPAKNVSDNSDDAVLKRNVKKVADKVNDLLGKDAFDIVSPKEYAKETISSLLKSKSGWQWIEDIIEPGKKDKDDTKVVKLLLPDNVLKQIHNAGKSEFSKFKSVKNKVNKLGELYDKADSYYSKHRDDKDAEKAYEAAYKKYKDARSSFVEAAGLLEDSVDKILKEHKSEIVQHINEV